MKAPSVSGKKVVNVLTKNGFVVIRKKGSHFHLTKTIMSKTFHVTIPMHGNRDLNPFVLHSIARQAGYAFEEFVKLF